jgi:hypothetical protein
VKLFTSVYVPKDVISDGRTYPILLQRTPYNVAPYGQKHSGQHGQGWDVGHFAARVFCGSGHD